LDALDLRVQNLPVAVQDLDGQRYSRSLLHDFERSNLFHVVRHATSEGELLGLLRSGTARVAIQIPSGYSAAMFYRRSTQVRVWVDGSDAVMAGQAVEAAQAIGLEQAVETSVQGLERRGKLLPVRAEVLFNPERRPVSFFVPGLVAMLTQTTTMLLVSLSFVKERERETLDQLRITNISLGSMIGGKLAASALVGLTTGFLLTALMRYFFDVPIAGSVWLLFASLALFLPAALGLGLIVTAQAQNQAQALQMIFLIGIPSVLLSGFVFPRESMPAPIFWFTHLLPTTWSLQIARGIVLRGAGLQDLGQAVMALTLLGLVYVSLGAFRLRRTLG
jgi:ABC-2 type transport system permease protein